MIFIPFLIVFVMDSKFFDLVRKQSGVNSSLSAIRALCDVASRLSSIELLDDIIIDLDLAFSRISDRIDFYTREVEKNGSSSCEEK